MNKRTKKLAVIAILTAVSGSAILSETKVANAELIDGVNKDIICKRPKTTERQLKIHSCATMQYPLAPLAPSTVEPEPTPTPPYTS